VEAVLAMEGKLFVFSKTEALNILFHDSHPLLPVEIWDSYLFSVKLKPYTYHSMLPSVVAGGKLYKVFSSCYMKWFLSQEFGDTNLYESFFFGFKIHFSMQK